MREPAPPNSAEGPHALWHVSEERDIRRFEPRPGSDGTPVVWAIDTRPSEPVRQAGASPPSPAGVETPTA